ncbi:MAG: cytochrome-c oxidase, cbb3-type subunit III [Halioglobus sp.]|nr:cytochrome-c oxidase, cbb3-type subunit III [Halioglobus sp.]
MSNFWSLWVIVLTVITFALMIWLLFSNRTREQEIDKQTTGHVYDGIEEYDNPLPAWWFYLFVITIVWGIGYLIAYPGLGNFPGLLKWTQLEQYEQRVAEAEEKYGAIREQYLAQPIEDIAGEPQVRKMGMRMFGNNCAQCHGADARGSYGFPNLTDEHWLWGSTPEAMKISIAEGRQAAMPAFGDVIGSGGVTNVTAYLLKLNGRDAEPALADAGEKVFQSNCVACHGADAGGNQALGAPDLKNDNWLYGGSPEQISHSIRAGRNGVMPPHKDLLSDAKIHIITAYVYGLSNQ